MEAAKWQWVQYFAVQLLTLNHEMPVKLPERASWASARLPCIATTLFLSFQIIGNQIFN
jgi:hypothetical protein